MQQHDYAKIAEESKAKQQEAPKKKTRWIDKFLKDEDVANPNKTAILAGLNRDPKIIGRGISYSHIYGGTVSPVEIAHRRKKNKAARKARRIQRARS